MDVLSEAPVPVPLPPALLPKERCDASQAEQALVRFQYPDGKLIDLCAHHADRYELALDFSGARIVEDLRPELTARETGKPLVPKPGTKVTSPGGVIGGLFDGFGQPIADIKRGINETDSLFDTEHSDFGHEAAPCGWDKHFQYIQGSCPECNSTTPGEELL
jgi:hypothetical protein